MILFSLDYKNNELNLWGREWQKLEFQKNLLFGTDRSQTRKLAEEKDKLMTLASNTIRSSRDCGKPEVYVPSKGNEGNSTL